MTWLLLLTVLNAAYVAALPSPTVFYIANMVIHLALGAATVLWLVFTKRSSPIVVPLGLAGILGLYLIFAGATTNHRWALSSHVALAVVGLAVLAPRWRAALVVLSIVAAALPTNGTGATWRPSISTASAASRRPSPSPPNSSGTRMPGTPSSKSALKTSLAKASLESAALRTRSSGETRSSVRRALSCIIFWSDVSPNSMVVSE